MQKHVTFNSHVYVIFNKAGFDCENKNNVVTISGRGLLLTTHPLLVPWVKKERGYTSSPPMRQNWRVTGILYLIFKGHTTSSQQLMWYHYHVI
jgi:hypothetical protein